MIADFLRDDTRKLPAHPDPAAVTALRIWHCKYNSLAALSKFTNVETLVIATYPDAGLEPLAGLLRLKYLSIMHLPKVSDLQPLSQLRRLRTARFSTLPSWDSSGKRTIVRSLEPLAGLPDLAHVELFGVLPEDGLLQPLERCLALESVRVSRYRKSEVSRFYSVTELRDSFAPSPSVHDWT